MVHSPSPSPATSVDVLLGTVPMLVTVDGTGIEARADARLSFWPCTADSGGDLLELVLSVPFGVLAEEVTVTLPIAEVLRMVRHLDTEAA